MLFSVLHAINRDRKQCNALLGVDESGLGEQRLLGRGLLLLAEEASCLVGPADG